jgi:organic radical activating enzyme
MNAETIILDLYRTGEIRKACLTITGGNPLWRDLEQETVMILLEKDPDKIAKMHQQKYLRFYIVRLIMNLYRGNNNQFAKKYRHHEERTEVDPEIESNAKDYDPLLDHLWTIAQQEMDSWAKDGAFPYDKELLNLLMQTGNMKAMSRETGIPYRSIIYSIEQAKAKIKTAIESHGYTGVSHPD